METPFFELEELEHILLTMKERDFTDYGYAMYLCDLKAFCDRELTELVIKRPSEQGGENNGRTEKQQSPDRYNR